MKQYAIATLVATAVILGLFEAATVFHLTAGEHYSRGEVPDAILHPKVRNPDSTSK